MSNENSNEYDDYFGFISENKKTDKSFLETYEEDLESSIKDESDVSFSSVSYTIDVSVSESVDFPLDYSYRLNPSVLWNKREFYYNLDRFSRDKIWKVFERRLKTSQRPNVFDKDLNEDAFYSSYRITPSYDISYLWEDKYINKILRCENLRSINMKFLEYNAVNTKEIEMYIQKYKTCNDPDNKIIYKGIILQKKQIEVFINKIRNYISEMILKGEEGYHFLERVYYIVFKKSPKLYEMNKIRCD